MDRIQVSVGKSNQLGQGAAVHSKFYFLLQIIVTRRDEKRSTVLVVLRDFQGFLQTLCGISGLVKQLKSK